MPDLDPRVHGAPPVPASTHGNADGSRRGATGEVNSGTPTKGHGDRAELSSAARSQLAREPVSVPTVEDPVGLADETVRSMQASIGVAANVHTAAIIRGARLIS